MGVWEQHTEYTYNYIGEDIEASMEAITVDESGNSVPARKVSEKERKSIAQSDDRDWAVIVTVFPERGEPNEDIVVPSADTLDEVEDKMETIMEDNDTDDEVIELARP